MVLTLYHCHDARSLRPLWTMEELGIDYELVNMEFPPRHKYEGYLDINPLGTVPTLIIDGITMSESSAIAQYLVEKFTPTDLSMKLGLNISHDDYPLYLDWLQRSDTTFTFPLTLVLRYSVFEKGQCKQAQVVNDYTRWFLSRLRLVEATLEDRDYLVADRFTVADICVGYAIYLGYKLKLSKQYGPRTLSYLERITDRDGFRRAEKKQSNLKPLLKNNFRNI